MFHRHNKAFLMAARLSLTVMSPAQLAAESGRTKCGGRSDRLSGEVRRDEQPGGYNVMDGGHRMMKYASGLSLNFNPDC